MGGELRDDGTGGLTGTITGAAITVVLLADLRVGPLFNFNMTALAAGGFKQILLDR